MSIKEKALATINHKIYCDETGEHFWDDGSRYKTAKALIEALDKLEACAEALGITNAEIKFGVFPEKDDDTTDMLIRNEKEIRNFLEKMG